MLLSVKVIICAHCLCLLKLPGNWRHKWKTIAQWQNDLRIHFPLEANTRTFVDAGSKTIYVKHMNPLRMHPLPNTVVAILYQIKKIQICFYESLHPKTWICELLSAHVSVQEQKRLRRILLVSGMQARSAGRVQKLLQRWWRKAYTCPPTQRFVQHQESDGFAILLDLCLQRSTPTKQTVLLCCIYFFLVTLPASVTASACVIASK